MNNIDRAAKIIDSLHTADQILMEGSVGYFDAPAAAQELADAGLLAPDLPPVTMPKLGTPEWDAYVADWDTEPMWETPERHGFSAGHEDGSVNVYVFRDGYTITDIDILTPEEAEALGLALLAAAQHAKGKA